MMRSYKQPSAPKGAPVKPLIDLGQPSEVDRSLLPLPIGGRTVYVSVGLIVRVEAEGNYSRVFVQDGRSYLIAVTLGKLAQRLPNFARIHRAHLVNRSHIKQMSRFKFTPGRPGSRFVHLTNGETLPVARRRSQGFLISWGLDDQGLDSSA